jgi:hypothetical protein
LRLADEPYLLTRSMEIEAKIWENASAMSPERVSLKKLLELLAQAGNTADVPSPPVSTCIA